MAKTTSGGGQVIDNAIEALDLEPGAKTAAYELKRLHPGLVFTSGRRDKIGQARAMASNVVKNRQWIVQTYRDSEARAACQKWVDDHPAAATQPQIQDGLLSVFNGLTGAQLDLNGKISVVRAIHCATFRHTAGARAGCRKWPECRNQEGPWWQGPTDPRRKQPAKE